MVRDKLRDRLRYLRRREDEQETNRRQQLIENPQVQQLIAYEQLLELLAAGQRRRQRQRPPPPPPPFHREDVPRLYIELIQKARFIEDRLTNAFLYELSCAQQRGSLRQTYGDLGDDFALFGDNHVFCRLLNEKIRDIKYNRFNVYEDLERWYRFETERGDDYPYDMNQIQRIEECMQRFNTQMNEAQRTPDYTNMIDVHIPEEIQLPEGYQTPRYITINEKLINLNKFVIDLFKLCDYLYRLEDQVTIEYIQRTGTVPSFNMFRNRREQIENINETYLNLALGYERLPAREFPEEDQYMNILLEEKNEIQMRIQELSV